MTAQLNATATPEPATQALAQEIFTDISTRWSLLVINALGDDTLRFTELRAAVPGISHKMLTQTVRMLERNGIVERLVHPVIPPRVDYSLTEPGRALRRTVNGICAWTQAYAGHVDAARHRFDARAQR